METPDKTCNYKVVNLATEECEFIGTFSECLSFIMLVSSTINNLQLQYYEKKEKI